MNFLEATVVKSKHTRTSKNKVLLLIKQFNILLKNPFKYENEDGSFHLNTGIDNIQELNPIEMDHAVELAKAKGWVLTQSDDNYDTVTYKLDKI